jgi:hypothetical protein
VHTHGGHSDSVRGSPICPFYTPTASTVTACKVPPTRYVVSRVSIRSCRRTTCGWSSPRMISISSCSAARSSASRDCLSTTFTCQSSHREGGAGYKCMAWCHRPGLPICGVRACTIANLPRTRSPPTTMEEAGGSSIIALLQQRRGLITATPGACFASA